MNPIKFLLPWIAFLLLPIAQGCDTLDPACENADYRFVDLVLPGEDGKITDHLQFRCNGISCYFYSTVVCDQACGGTSFSVTFAYRFVTSLFRKGIDILVPYVRIDSGVLYYPSFKDATNPMTCGVYGELFTLNEGDQKVTPASFNVEVGFNLVAYDRSDQELRELLKSMINYFHINVEYLKLQ